VHHYDGAVLSINGNSIVIQKRTGGRGTYRVNPDTPVILAKSRKGLSDLQPGQRVRVWATEEGEVTKLQIRSVDTEAGASVAEDGGPGDSRLIDGEVLSVDRESNTFALKLRSGGTVRFAVERSTKINEHGAKGGLVDSDFSALAPGRTVRLEVLYGKVDAINVNRIRE
jgi:hypothetical protein